jgi:polyribonucleotide 5'-hydroxyl-kinase
MTLSYPDPNSPFLAETMAPSSALPIGASRVVSELQPLLVDPSQGSSGLLNSVLALLASPSHDGDGHYDEELLDLHVVGFLIVSVCLCSSDVVVWRSIPSSNSTGLDIPNRKMTILSPGPGSFAGRTAVIASTEWQDM